jgi:hypothetical protein
MWTCGLVVTSATTKAQLLVNASRRALLEVKWHALSAAHKNPRRNSSVAALKAIQHELAALTPHPLAEPCMRWLVLVSVQNSREVQKSLSRTIRSLPLSNFSIFHYDSRSEADHNFKAWLELAWYRDSYQIVHRSFARGAGCTIEALITTIGWMRGQAGYTHLWKVDSDLEFGLCANDQLNPTACTHTHLTFHS